ncbi:hypothetical protein Slala05_48630 [Streptomyces lavendulae subsp. lavendulae]|nr:hypothetical protein Slala05_48630 [Streptomyces lavendulae subsp. lavendulae]
MAGGTGAACHQPSPSSARAQGPGASLTGASVPPGCDKGLPGGARAAGPGTPGAGRERTGTDREGVGGMSS